MILVLGLGNPVLSDDAVGLRVIEALRREELEGVDARECFSDLDIFEGLRSGYSHVVFVDSVDSGGKPGTVYKTSLSQMGLNLSTHNFNLNLIKYIESLEGKPRITVLAVEVKDTQTISERCTPEVEGAISKILNTVETLSTKLNYYQQKV